jgi:hypothetical protein
MSDTNNTIDGLRVELFATLRALRDQEKPMPVDRARAVAEVAGKIIDSAKVEVEHAKVTKQIPASGFLPRASAESPQRPAIEKPRPDRELDLVGVPVRGALCTGPKAALS